MLTKMKQMLRNEKGFTLVELLAVIVILGIIVTIAVPAIGNIISDAEGDAEDAQEELILDAARLADVQGDFESGTTTVGDLVTDDYLEDRIEDEDGDGTKEFDKSKVIYKDGATYTFTNPTK
ncbi:hypothetical protein GCM10011351_11380 [Paraliobacillus quinghaiensis]|uniref:Prepilin-type N-terminal cleavage/methylation domain-containing protein n=1 Tax=Paraliobacillus quinghaiensis TaxID=470815 RepID=A0A917TL67_9BACI|nr:type II secretion system protein [Paraliobacillus quinghaiensis]GGM27290.1 hypothetical protein GCM10011351_11380 [Paraliobacillus quinghaiensis]